MPSITDDENALANPWIVHVLALITSLTFLFALYINLFVLKDGEIYQLDLIVGLPVGLAVIWFFGWMAADAIGGIRTSSRVPWLIFMLLLPLFSSLIYYFFVWRAAKSRTPIDPVGGT